jgi:hypothetical protein
MLREKSGPGTFHQDRHLDAIREDVEELDRLIGRILELSETVHFLHHQIFALNRFIGLEFGDGSFEANVSVVDHVDAADHLQG